MIVEPFACRRRSLARHKRRWKRSQSKSPAGHGGAFYTEQAGMGCLLRRDNGPGDKTFPATFACFAFRLDGVINAFPC